MSVEYASRDQSNNTNVCTLRVAKKEDEMPGQAEKAAMSGTPKTVWQAAAKGLLTDEVGWAILQHSIENSRGSYMMANPELTTSAIDGLTDVMRTLKRGESKQIALDVPAQMSHGRDGRAEDLTGYTLLHTAPHFFVAGTVAHNLDNSYSFTNMTYTYEKWIKPSSRYDAATAVGLGNSIMGGNALDYMIAITWKVPAAKWGKAWQSNSGWPWGE